MSEVIQRTVKDVSEVAEFMGLVCVLAKSNELLIDIDGDLGQYYKSLAVLENNKDHLHIISRLTTRSKSGNYHEYLRIDAELPAPTRIALQAALGSDPIRELLSIIRVISGSEPEAVTALFETEEEAKKVAAWRDPPKQSPTQGKGLVRKQLGLTIECPNCGNAPDGCIHCNGWGYVAKGPDSECIHLWKESKKIGRCLHIWQCIICGHTKEVDSSG